MRLLHAGDADQRARSDPARPRRLGNRNPQRARRQSVPLHRLHEHRQRDRRGGRDAEGTGQGVMQTATTAAKGIGASVLRREDARHLDGRGEFVPDIRLPGIRDVAFLRSPHAHARLKSITVPPAAKGRVFTPADLPRVQPIRVVTQAAGAKSPPWPPLATDKVRYVGEAIAVCIAATRGEAEDLASQIEVDYEVLDAAIDAPAVWRSSRHLIHESWGDNLYLERTI